MSVLVYGNDTIRMGRILNYSVSAEMSSDGMDYIRTRHDVDFQGVVSTDLGQNAVAAAALIAGRITQPRQPFKLYAGGSTSANLILSSNAPDMYGGPKCTNFSVNNFAGYRTAIVNCSFLIYTHDCTDIPRVLSNRWSVEHSLDQNYYTRRVVTGELNINPQFRLNADDAREYCFKGIPKGMQMVNGSFRQSPDGLKLAYSIIAEEKYQLPPGVATDLKAEYNETTSNGARTEAEMWVDVVGPRTASKAQLLAIAAQIILSRFDFKTKVNGAPTDTLIGGNIREVLHENRVTISVRGLKTQSKDHTGFGARIDNRFFGLAIPNAPNGKGQQIPIYGNTINDTHGYRAIAAAWKGACADSGVTTPSGIGLNTAVGDGEFDNLQYSVGELPAPAADNISEGQRAAAYNYYHLGVTHGRDTGKVAMPIAKKNESSSGGEPRPRTVSIVRLMQPTTYKSIRYHCERVDAMPEHPKVSVKPGLTLMKDEFHVGTPQLAADGVTKTYYATGWIIVQVHGNVDIDSEDIQIGVNPTTTFTIQDEGTLTPGDFKTTMLEE